MKEVTDYSAFVVGPSQDRFIALDKLVQQVRREEARLDRLGKAMAAAQERLRALTWSRLPEMMAQMGMKEFTNHKGLHVTVKEQVEAGISEANRDAAHKWLDDNGHSGLMKRDVIVSFNKDQAEKAKGLIDTLSKEYAAVQEKKTVHPSSLKAWAREMLREGREVPVETFGIFVRKVAQINESKKR